MKRRLIILLCIAASALMLAAELWAQEQIKLPEPNFTGKVSVEAAIAKKKSVRSYTSAGLSTAEASQMLWAANGNLPKDAVAGPTTKVIPSAGGFYPLEVFLVTGKDTVKGIPAGIYQYVSQTNSLTRIAEGDSRNLLSYACYGQAWIGRAPAIIAIAGVFDRSTGKYGSRGYQYTYMESGNANQNLYLQAEGLGLRVATVGAFDDAQVAGVLKLPANTTPLLIVTMGK
jgi:SagB-type dehydrogenase family enzyme